MESRLRPRPRTTAKAKDLSHKDLSHKAKDLDFGLKDQGQGLTSLDGVQIPIGRGQF